MNLPISKESLHKSNRKVDLDGTMDKETLLSMVNSRKKEMYSGENKLSLKEKDIMRRINKIESFLVKP